MAIRDENDNKVTPLMPQTNDDEVIKTAIWKGDVKEAVSKVDHGRYEYKPYGKVVYDTKTTATKSGAYQKTAREIDFKKTLRYFPELSNKTNAMIFIKSPVEQPYNYVGKDNCENACFAIVITKPDGFNDTEKVYDMALFGLRDGWLNAEITEDDNQKLSYFSDIDVSIQGPAVLLKYKRVQAENLPLLIRHINNLISDEYRLFMSDNAHTVLAPNAINTYMETINTNEDVACQDLVQQLNAWPDGVRSYDELLSEVFHKVAAEQSKYINPAEEAISALSKLPYDDEYIDLLVAKEHWLDMKAANEKGLLYPSGPFSGMIQSGECADPDKMLEMIDVGIKNITDRDKRLKMIDIGIKNQSERGER